MYFCLVSSASPIHKQPIMIETIIFIYAATFFMAVLENLSNWKIHAQLLGFVVGLIITPIFLIYRFLVKVFKVFDKYFLVDIISFLVLIIFNIWMTFQIHLMLINSPTAHHILLGILVSSIAFSLIYKIIQLPKKYNRENIFHQV